MFARSLGKFFFGFDIGELAGIWIEIWIDSRTLMDMEMTGMTETLDGF